MNFLLHNDRYYQIPKYWPYLVNHPVYILKYCRVTLQKLTFPRLVEIFPTFCGAWRFFIVVTSAHHLSLSWVPKDPFQSSDLFQFEAVYSVSLYIQFLWLRFFSPSPNPQAGGPLLVRCQCLIIQHICNYRPFLEAFSAIHNLKTHHAVVTGTI
jgi:hypothetical protein